VVNNANREAQWIFSMT